jgi:hypothetical protein
VFANGEVPFFRENGQSALLRTIADKQDLLLVQRDHHVTEFVGTKRMKEKVRYAVIGLGHIAQTAVLPAFAHAENSELVALVTRSPDKNRQLSRRYRVNAYADLETARKSMPFTLPLRIRFTANILNVPPVVVAMFFAKNPWLRAKTIAKR